MSCISFVAFRTQTQIQCILTVFFFIYFILVCNFYTTECKGLRWNKLIIISQVPMDLRKTKPTEAQSGQNRDEQNKQFVGDLLFGHNPPDQNDSGGKKQQKHKKDQKYEKT
jgi:hypothetical protein